MCRQNASLHASSWLGYSWDFTDFADSAARVSTLPASQSGGSQVRRQSRRDKFRQDPGPPREELQWLQIISILRKVSVPSFLSPAGRVDQKIEKNPFGSSKSGSASSKIADVTSLELGFHDGKRRGEEQNGAHSCGETNPPSAQRDGTHQVTSSASMDTNPLKLQELLQDLLWPFAAVGDMASLHSMEIAWESIPESADPMRGSGYKVASSGLKHAETRQGIGKLETEEDDDSGHGGLCMGRGERKRLQVENIASVLSSFQLKAGSRIVDFGCGSGALTLPLAALFPDLSFVGVDFKQQCITLLEERARKADLRNVVALHGRIESFSQSFDACVALHACGIATDLALLQALKNRAAYVMSPCCVGKLQIPIQQVLLNSAQHMQIQKRFCPTSTTTNSVSNLEAPGKTHPKPVDSNKMPLEGLESNLSLNCIEVGCQFTEVDTKQSVSLKLAYPRSRWLRLSISENEFEVLARAADWSSYDHGSSVSRLHAVCKVLVEMDRNEASQELGYSTSLFYLSNEKAGTVGVSHLLIGKPM